MLTSIDYRPTLSGKHSWSLKINCRHDSNYTPSTPWPCPQLRICWFGTSYIGLQLHRMRNLMPGRNLPPSHETYALQHSLLPSNTVWLNYSADLIFVNVRQIALRTCTYWLTLNKSESFLVNLTPYKFNLITSLINPVENITGPKNFRLMPEVWQFTWPNVFHEIMTWGQSKSPAHLKLYGYMLYKRCCNIRFNSNT